LAIVQHARANRDLLVNRQIVDPNVSPAVNVINKKLALTKNVEIHAKALAASVLNAELLITTQFARVQKASWAIHLNNVYQNQLNHLEL